MADFSNSQSSIVRRSMNHGTNLEKPKPRLTMTKALRRFSKISQDMLGSNFQSQMDEAIKEIDDIIITTLKNAR